MRTSPCVEKNERFADGVAIEMEDELVAQHVETLAPEELHIGIFEKCPEALFVLRSIAKPAAQRLRRIERLLQKGCGISKCDKPIATSFPGL